MFRVTCLPFICGVSVCPEAVLFSREDGPGEAKGKQKFLLKKHKYALKTGKPALSKVDGRACPVFLRKEIWNESVYNFKVINGLIKQWHIRCVSFSNTEFKKQKLLWYYFTQSIINTERKVTGVDALNKYCGSRPSNMVRKRLKKALFWVVFETHPPPWLTQRQTEGGQLCILLLGQGSHWDTISCPTLKIQDQCYPDLGRVLTNYPGKKSCHRARPVSFLGKAMPWFSGSREGHAEEGAHLQTEHEARPRAHPTGRHGVRASAWQILRALLWGGTKRHRKEGVVLGRIKARIFQPCPKVLHVPFSPLFWGPASLEE